MRLSSAINALRTVTDIETISEVWSMILRIAATTDASRQALRNASQRQCLV